MPPENLDNLILQNDERHETLKNLETTSEHQLLKQDEISQGIQEINTTLETILLQEDESDDADRIIEAIHNISKVEIPEGVEEVTIKNLPEVQKVEITNLPIEKDNSEILNFLKEIKPTDLKKVEDLLTKISNKEEKDVDVAELKNISSILEEILNKEDEELKPEFKEIHKALKSLNESIKKIDIPSFDYKKFGDEIRDNLKLNFNGGGSSGSVELRNIAQQQINPMTNEKGEEILQTLQNLDVTINAGDIEIGAVELKDGTTDTRVKIKTDGTDNALVVTQNSQPLPTGASTEAKQDTQITALNTIATNTGASVMSVDNSLTASAYDLNTSAYSASTAITDDYELDSIAFDFTTSISKTITITTAQGTKLYEDTTSATNLVVSIKQKFNASENITVAVTQTAGACLMDLRLKTTKGSNTLLGDPNVGVTDTTDTRIDPATKQNQTNGLQKTQIVDASGNVISTTLHDTFYWQNVVNLPVGWAIAAEELVNHSNFSAIGYNNTVGTTFEDIWGPGGTYVFPTSAIQMRIVSSSANDAGTLITSGTSTGGSTTTLIDTGKDFVALGVIAGDAVLNDTNTIFGVVVTVDSTTQITIQPQAELTYSGKAYRIVRAASTGASVIEVHGLDSNYVEQEEFVITNGLTGVNTTKNYIRINNIHSMHTGTNATGVGNISLQNVAGTVTYCYIFAGENLNSHGIYTVPAGKNCFLVAWDGGSSGTKPIRFLLRANCDYHDRSLIPSGILQSQDQCISNNGTINKTFEIPKKFPPKCDIKISGAATSGTSEGTCSFEFWLETV